MKRFTWMICLVFLAACTSQSASDYPVANDGSVFDISSLAIECAVVIDRANYVAELRFQRVKRNIPDIPTGEPPCLFSVAVKITPEMVRMTGGRFVTRAHHRLQGFPELRDGTIRLSLLTRSINVETGRNTIASSTSSVLPQLGCLHFIAGQALVDALRSDFRWCGDDEVQTTGFDVPHTLIETNARIELEQLKRELIPLRQGVKA
jgi:hypothetical protein